MLDKSQILKNVTATLSQTIVFGLTLFFLYRYLLDVLGPEKLGVWSVVLASTSVTKIANLGLSGSVVKFVAKYRALEKPAAVSRVLQTSMLAIGAMIGLALLAIYPFSHLILSYIIESETGLADALSIVPYAFISVWLSAIMAVLISGLDGHQRIDIRGGLMIASTIIHATLCFILVGPFGLVGLAVAQIFQFAFTIFVAFFFLRRLANVPLIPYQWDNKLFREMFFYGVNFQVMGFAAMLFDPVTKGLLAKFGGLSMTGYYELANRLVSQARTLVTSANQVLVPTVADLQERAPKEISRVYRLSTQAVFFVSVPVFSLLYLCVPLIAQIWLNDSNPAFVVSARLLIVGWFFNTLVGPTFFIYLGTGRLRWNAMGQILIGVLNLVCGWFLGQYFGGTGVVVGWVIALSAGSVFLIVAYWRENEGAHREFCSFTNILLAAAGLLAILLLASLPNLFSDSTHVIIQLTGMAGLLFLMLGIPLWLHPFRSVTQHVLTSRIF